MTETKAPIRKKPHQQIQGLVVSDKMDKTRVIEIKTKLKHNLYLKSLVRTSRLFVHDEKNQSKVGDTITVIPTRPMSKNKHFKLLQIVSKSEQAARSEA